MASFNLVDEPWMPCVFLDGSRGELGLAEVLEHAPQIREIYDPSPLVTAALHRLLLAVLHRNFGPRNFDAWAVLWRGGRWPPEMLDRYFSRWRGRFELFDPEVPFYQMASLDSDAVPITRLAQERASGHNATLFDHSRDEAPAAVPPREAARLLVATQAFALGGGVSHPFNLSDGPAARGLLVFAQGESLFETLALNLVAYNESEPLSSREHDCPAWEQNTPREPVKAGTAPVGYLDYLTWQSRAVRLIPQDESGLVARCQIRQNLKLPDGAVIDPFKCYDRRRTGWIPKRFRAERALWRDSHALFQRSGNESNSRRPAVLNWLALLGEAQESGRVAARSNFRLSALGLASPGQAKVDFWRHERLPLPLAYLDDDNLLHTLERALGFADRAAKALGDSVRHLARLTLAPMGRSPDPKDVRALAASLGTDRRFWASLELPFTSLLSALPDDRADTGDGLIEYGLVQMPQWADVLRRSAREAFGAAAASLEASPRSFKAVAQAERRFTDRLADALRAEAKGGSQ